MTDSEKSEIISEDIKNQLKEKYAEVQKVLDNEKNDPESEPYKSKYAAKEILESMLNLCQSSIDNSNHHGPEVSPILGVIYLNLGILSIDTDELKAGEDYLLNCINVIGLNDIPPQIILTTLSALNQLGILWSRRNEPLKAQGYLEQAESIYKTFKELSPASIPVNMSAVFGVPDEIPSTEVLEKVHTLTLYYLAQIYGTLEQFLKSALYCHMTLQRQLEQKDFDSIDWALNAATLSQFFMEKECFTESRHHLSAATYILGKYEEALKERTEKEGQTEEVAAKWENFKHRSADIARCWAKYGLLLLSMSRDRLIEKNNEDNQEKSDENEKEKSVDLSKESLTNLNFPTIKNEIEHICNSVTDKYLLDFNDAKEVFLNVQKWLDDAKTYYTLEEHASDYVQIIQDMSQVYKHLTFFEEDEERQAKMHKRRIDLLEGVKKELNEQYYQSVFKELWIELGETYTEILDIKIDRLKATDERPSPHVLAKINHLTTSAIANFKAFLKSVKNTKTDKFPDELLRPALCSYFHLGRLYNKFITFDKKLQLENTKESFLAYMALVNYCEKNVEAQEVMVEELSVCKEFVKLLPAKIKKIQDEIASS